MHLPERMSRAQLRELLLTLTSGSVQHDLHASIENEVETVPELSLADDLLTADKALDLHERNHQLELLP